MPWLDGCEEALTAQRAHGDFARATVRSLGVDACTDVQGLVGEGGLKEPDTVVARRKDVLGRVPGVGRAGSPPPNRHQSHIPGSVAFYLFLDQNDRW